MAVGTVYKFVSQQVAGNRPKPKYHICVSLSDGLFLFINSQGFRGSMKITQAEWAEMPNPVSFVSCTHCIRYTKDEMRRATLESCGSLTYACLDQLYAHVEASMTMPQEDIDEVMTCLETVLTGY